MHHGKPIKEQLSALLKSFKRNMIEFRHSAGSNDQGYAVDTKSKKLTFQGERINKPLPRSSSTDSVIFLIHF